MTPPARATIWVESRGFPEIALPLHLPVTAISFILSCLGGMGVALPGMPSRPGCQRRKGRRVWQGQPSPLGSASSESPPPAQGGTESRQVRGLRRPGQSRGSRCTGMASCEHCSCRRPRLPLPTARPAGGAPLLWGSSLPTCRALCQLPGHHRAWPQICDLVPETWMPKVGRGGVGWGVKQEAPTPRV